MEATWGASSRDSRLFFHTECRCVCSSERVWQISPACPGILAHLHWAAVPIFTLLTRLIRCLMKQSLTPLAPFKDADVLKPSSCFVWIQKWQRVKLTAHEEPYPSCRPAAIMHRPPCPSQAHLRPHIAYLNSLGEEDVKALINRRPAVLGEGIESVVKFLLLCRLPRKWEYMHIDKGGDPLYIPYNHPHNNQCHVLNLIFND